MRRQMSSTGKRHLPKSTLWRIVAPYALLLPAILFITMFVLYPMVSTVVISLFHVDSLGRTERYVGLANFSKILNDPEFSKALTNTLYYALLTVPLSKIFGLLLALLARKQRRTTSIYVTLFSLPIAISVPSIALIFGLLYSPRIGLINRVFHTSIEWLLDPHFAMTALCVIGIWISTGYAFVFLLPAVRDLPQELIEAAQLDGAGALRRIVHMYIPLLSPTIFFLIIIDIPTSLMMMSLPNILTAGGPERSTTTLLLYIYQLMTQDGDYSGANAATVLAVLLMSVVLFAVLKLERKVVFYS